ncbi:hypothetical protein [Glaciimonas sp. PCH181]|uniref:hypothetical protein n=1 Tax=Glaciimonas sp. PCH181 TaxID=2133943 RepID=UPI000D355EFD|nr:hypothetical protein [Glaciimonas sp. PCH181]PUA18825.1 hypothetical protein C7W93_02615 [Glaciimonas sp. PCH181]
MKQRINFAAEYGRLLGHRGDQIRMHRSLRVLEFPRSRWLQIVLLPLGLNVLTLLAVTRLARFWSIFLLFWFDRLDLPGQITHTGQFALLGQLVTVPAIHLAGAIPTTSGWLLHIALTLFVLALSFWLPISYMPLRYLLRVLVFVHSTALFYFGFSPASFPYDLETYSRDALVMMIVFLLIIPWLLAFSYYIYSFPVAKKIGFTLVMMLYFCVFAPTQLLVHAIFLYHFSALMLPLLYLVFGAFLNVMLFMAFYSWAMSE